MFQLIFNVNSYRNVGCAAALAGFAVTILMLVLFRDKLPTDLGRAYAINGEKSKGKPRGAGIVWVLTFIGISLIFVPISIEYGLYYVMLACAMATGFLDDASRKPWGELKKGLFDLAIAVGTTVIYVCCNPNATHLTMPLFNTTADLPTWLFIVLGTILVWASINVVNCTDGVDGLSSTLSLVGMGAVLAVLMKYGDTIFAMPVAIMMSCVAAYLLFNCGPSIMLMGDAGSRTLGVFFAIAAMKTGCALCYVPLFLVFIIDGGLGLLKLSCIRFLKMKNFMKNTRTPIHDHFRKNKGWSDTQTVARFAIVQLVIGFAYICLM